MIVYSLVLTLLLFGFIGCSEYDKLSNLTSVVSLNRLTVNAKIVPYCAGTVIHKQQVLTAAHCVVDVNGTLDITGIIVLSGSIDLRYSVKNKVKSGLIHPNYTHSELTDDVAILVIEGFFPDWIKPMELVRTVDNIKNDIVQCVKIEWAGKRYVMDGKESVDMFYIYNKTEQEEDAIMSISEFDCEDHCIRKSLGIRMSHLTYDTPENIIVLKNYTVSEDERHLIGRQYDDSENYGETGGPVMCYGVQYGIVSWVDEYSPQIPTISVSSSVLFYINWIEKSSMYLDNKEKSPIKIIARNGISTNDENSTVVAIYRLTEGGKLVPYCGGTIIHRRIVLTAASCITNNGYSDLPEVFVVSGSTDLRFGRIHKVVKTLSHPKYDWMTRENDLAISLVDIPFTKPLIPTKRIVGVDNNPSLNSSCKIYEWIFKERSIYFQLDLNTKEPAALTTSTFDCGAHCHLQSASVNTVSQQDFVKIFDKVTNDTIRTDGSQFYTFGGLHDTCNENYGSPIICSGIQYGIVPWRTGCRKVDEPLLINAIRSYNDWIYHSITSLVKLPKTEKGNNSEYIPIYGL